MEIKADVVDYMGKLDDGVLVLINISYEKKFYEGVIFYSERNIQLTVDDSLEELIGTPIQLWENYKFLLESILKKLVPCSEIYNSIDFVDIEKWVDYNKSDILVENEIDPKDIISLTHSNLPQ